MSGSVRFGRWVTAVVVVGVSVCTGTCVEEIRAQEPGWVRSVFKSPSERAASQATPIIERPYRPLHFYGNTVRRMHYRQNPLPSPQDLIETTRGLVPTPPAGLEPSNLVPNSLRPSSRSPRVAPTPATAGDGQSSN